MRDILTHGPGPQHFPPDSSNKASGGDSPKYSFSGDTFSEGPQHLLLGHNDEAVGVMDVKKGAPLGTGSQLLKGKEISKNKGDKEKEVKILENKKPLNSNSKSNDPKKKGSKKGYSGSAPDGMGQGGRSRSRKHSVSKRTRRKGVAKKQKSKKNKRQSRRKSRRSSSRKSRK
jgi:hypothetical protein